MSAIYGVLTVGRHAKVVQRSLSGDDFGQVEVAVTLESGKDYTYRLRVTPDGEFVLFRIAKRWKDATSTPETQWEVIHDEDDIIIAQEHEQIDEPGDDVLNDPNSLVGEVGGVPIL